MRHESTEPETHQMAKIGFLLLVSFSRQAILWHYHDSFYTKTEAFYTEQCTTPLLFNFSIDNYPLKNSFGMPFSSLYTCARMIMGRLSSELCALLSFVERCVNGLTSVGWTVECWALYYNEGKSDRIFSALPHHVGTDSTCDMKWLFVACTWVLKQKWNKHYFIFKSFKIF